MMRTQSIMNFDSTVEYWHNAKRWYVRRKSLMHEAITGADFSGIVGQVLCSASIGDFPNTIV